MSKQHSQSPANRQELAGDRETKHQSHDPGDLAKNHEDPQRDAAVQQGGGEESQHGRKQKGNSDGT